jgi:hypothetical protein
LGKTINASAKKRNEINMIRKTTISALLGLIALCSTASFPVYADDDRESPVATVITFQDLSSPDELVGIGTTYSSQGYTFSYEPTPDELYPVGFMAVGPSWRYNTGTTALLANSVLALTTLTSDTNQPFTLKSIDLAETNGPGPVTVVFQGTTANGTHVSQEFTLDGETGFQKFTFHRRFSNLKSVTWLQGDNVTNNVYMIDNVKIATTNTYRRADD